MTKRELRKHFKYSADGTFIRRTSCNRWMKGLKVRGSRRNDGYLSIYLNGESILFHRAVFIYHFGKIKGEIDHKNGHRNDNRIKNLRDVSRTENLCNLFNNPFNKTGVKGLHMRRGRWVGQIRFKRKTYEVSSKNKRQAVLKLQKLRKKIHGLFARS